MKLHAILYGNSVTYIEGASSPESQRNVTHHCHGILQPSAYAKISYLCLSFEVNKQVCRLDISVNQVSGAMQVAQSLKGRKFLKERQINSTTSDRTMQSS